MDGSIARKREQGCGLKINPVHILRPQYLTGDPEGLVLWLRSRGLHPRYLIEPAQCASR
jgi:hypothetical protein